MRQRRFSVESRGIAVDFSLLPCSGLRPRSLLNAASSDDYPALYASHARRIKSSSARFRSSADADDLVQAGRIALWRAMRSFDPTHGIPFEHYAARSIRRAIRDEAQRERRHWQNRHCENPASASEERDLGVAAMASNDPPASEVVDASILHARADNLPNRLHRIYQLRYMNDLSQSETATLLGITQQRVSQLERTLIATLRGGYEPTH
jgi:RNA polymerase sigma factor (sigma-70 family)